MEENGPGAEWRREHLSATELRWADDQRQLRAHLVTTDKLDFAWPDTIARPKPTDKKAAKKAAKQQRQQAAAASASLTTTPEHIDEVKNDSEATAASSSCSGSDSSSIDPSTAVKPPLTLVAGVDISFVGDEVPDLACAALVVLSYPEMKVVYQDYEMVTLTQPYIAGFLAFREVDHLLRLLNRLRSDSPHLLPQLILVDGNGVLHHRGFGLASHLSVLADVPAIGIGKNLLLVDGLDRTVVQTRANDTLKRGGESFDLVGVSGTVWGAVLRPTDLGSNPIYVSIGSRISLPTAVDIVHACCSSRIPEPVRLADLNSRDFIRKWKASPAALPFLSAASSAAVAASSSSAPASSAVAPVDTESVDPSVSLAPPSAHEEKSDAESSAPHSEGALTSRQPSWTPAAGLRNQRQVSEPITVVRSAAAAAAATASPSAASRPRAATSSPASAAPGIPRSRSGTYIPAERTPACTIS